MARGAAEPLSATRSCPKSSDLQILRAKSGGDGIRVGGRVARRPNQYGE